jgi:hypothetical protein
MAADFDLSSARPTYAQNSPSGGFDLASATTANQPHQTSSLDSALNTLNRIGKGVLSAGPLETAAHLGSGAVAGLGGGLGFISQLATNGGNVDDAKQFQQKVQSDFTYQPRTQAGRALAGAADKALGLIPKGISTVSEGLLDQGLQDPEMAGFADLSDPNTRGTVTPGMAAALNTAGNAALNFLPLKGAYRAATGAERASTTAANAAAAQAAAAKAAAPRPVPTTPAELLQQSLDNGKAVGYQSTPNYDPQASLLERAGQGIAGEAQTMKGARGQNQPVTNALAARAIGQDPASLITHPGLAAIRKAAVEQGYEPIQNLPGDIAADTQYLRQNQAIKSTHGNELSGNPDVVATADLLNRATFSPSVILDHISALRSRASDAFSAGRSDAAVAFRKQASELESLLDRHLQDQDNLPTGMLTKYRAARQLIAKTHTIGDNLNPSTGNVNAAGIGQALKDGVPLEGDLKTIADFANSAPPLATVPNGTPQITSPINTMAGTMAAHSTGGLSLALIPGARAFATKFLERHNSNPALLQPRNKTLGQTALDAVHGNATAFAKIYGNAAPGAFLSTEGP